MDQVYDVFTRASIFVPVLVGLAKAAQMIILPKKWTPVWNIVIGIAISIIYVYPQDFKTAIVVGIMLGLTASGLYSGVRSTAQAILKQE